MPKMLTFLLIVLFLHESSCQNESICAHDANNILSNGESVYKLEVHNGDKICLIHTCATQPLPKVTSTSKECNEVNSNCSAHLNYIDQNVSICCEYCSECDFLTCPENSQCVEEINRASCQCLQGYEAFVFDGLLSCIDTNECVAGSYKCPSNSDCVNTLGSFNCLCHSGYSGPACTDVNECLALSDICPPFAQCMNHDGFYECICDKECAFSITSYYLTTPNDPVDFFEQNPGCLGADDTFPNLNVVVCTGKQQILTDGITEASIPPIPNQYIGWNRTGDGFTIIVNKSYMRLTQVDFYYYNNPSTGIGLPVLSSIYMSSMQANRTLLGPLSFVYANNQDLTQDDNGMRMASIIITSTTDEISSNQFVHFNFNYTSSLIWRTQLTAIQAFGGTDSIQSRSEIIFHSELHQVIHLGVEDIVSQVMLSCTVANEGSFSWEWTKPANGTVISSGLKKADLTRTSILIISDLSIEVGGEYACRAFYSEGSLVFENTGIIVLELANEVIKESIEVPVHASNVILSCEFIGYYPKYEYTVMWDFKGRSISNYDRKYTIRNASGSKGQSQSGGSFPGPSLISYLTISTVEQEDTGIYGCRIIGSFDCSQLIGYVQVSTVEEICSYVKPSLCPSMETSTITKTGTVWLTLCIIMFILGTVFFIVMFLVIVRTYYKHYFRSTNHDKEITNGTDSTKKE